MTTATEGKELKDLAHEELALRDRVYFTALERSSVPLLETLRGKTLALRDASFLELARQKELLRRNTVLLSDLNAELAFRAVDVKRAELADKFHSLTQKGRLQGLLRLMRFYVHTRHVNPIVRKPAFAKDSVTLPFRVVSCDNEGETEERWHEFCVGIMGERLVRHGRLYVSCSTNILETHPREWKVETQ